jgi:hypothetical protein
MNAATQIPVNNPPNPGLHPVQVPAQGVAVAASGRHPDPAANGSDTVSLKHSSPQARPPEPFYYNAITSVREKTASLIRSINSGHSPFSPEAVTAHKEDVESLLS